MKTSFYCCKFAFILTFFLSFAVADALTISVSDVSVDKYYCPLGAPVEVDFTLHYTANALGETKFIHVKAYASSDSTITESDFYLGITSIFGRYRGSGTITDSLTGLFPTDIPSGDYYVGIICSGDSDYDANPVFVDAELVPDLELTYIGIWDSNSIILGGWGSVNFTVKNIGSYESGEFVVYLYASEDTTITDDDYEARYSHVGSLDPGEDTNIDKAFRLPDDIPCGDYYIGAVISCRVDINEENNSGYDEEPLTVAWPPDIEIPHVDAEGFIHKPGDEIRVNITVKNDGMGRSTSYSVDYYASTNLRISTSDYYIGNALRGPLEPGEEHEFETLCALPDDIPKGYYCIGVIVTWSYDIGSGKTESVVTSSVCVGIPADMAIQSVQVTPGAYLPGDEFVIYSLIENIGELSSESYTIDYYASIDATITTQDHHIGYANRSGLAATEQHSYDTICQFPFNIAAGNYYIGIIVTCPYEYDPANNIGCDSATIELFHPAGYVCGQMQYQDRRRREHPIRYALVEIYDDDNNDNPLDDRVIGKTHTDHNGNYGVIVLNDEDSGQEIYLKVFTEGVSGAYPETTSRICDVLDDIFSEPYSLESPPYSHPQDSSVIIEMTASDSGGEFMVYDSVIEGFDKAKTFFGIELGEITTYWPCSEDASYFDPCDVGIFIAQDDRSDRDVIMHEYGHYIADTYGFAQGFVGEDSTHYWDLDLRYYPVDRTNEEARNLAFREAWASLFSVATQRGDTFFGDTEYEDRDEASGKTFSVDLEKGTAGHDSPGQYHENMNCCALWDIFDDKDNGVDDNDKLSDTSLSKIWTISRDCKPDDIIDFWNSWFKSYDYASEITRIFQDHEMSFIKPESRRSDLNCDNVVNFYDFSKFAEHYPSSSDTPIYDERYDLNNDNVITLDDLIYLAQDWLQTVSEGP